MRTATPPHELSGQKIFSRMRCINQLWLKILIHYSLVEHPFFITFNRTTIKIIKGNQNDNQQNIEGINGHDSDNNKEDGYYDPNYRANPAWIILIDIEDAAMNLWKGFSVWIFGKHYHNGTVITIQVDPARDFIFNIRPGPGITLTVQCHTF